MKSTLLTSLIFILFISTSEAQDGKIVTLSTETGSIEGTLLTPDTEEPPPVVLIIAGSGPTDRDGNNPMMKNNSLKMLATELHSREIASLRYDKRGVGSSAGAGLEERKLRFDHYVDDAAGWIAQLKEDERFGEVIVAGHSEGSLIGMITAKEAGAEKFISIAGPAEPADEIIRQQLQGQPDFVLDEALPILDQLVQGQTVDSIPPMLNSLFRESVQPYMISWFAYNPQEVVTKLDIPVLVIQGDTDIQVDVRQAELLSEAYPDTQLEIIEGMNHVLKNSEADRQQNTATYNQPDLPINTELIDHIEKFTKE